MNKKLLVGAVAMAITGLAQAQSNVTLYGVADLGLQVLKSPNGNVMRESSGIHGGSRWGMRGTEDLGGGLKANFNLESGIGVDTGASGQGGLLFGRRATVGLSGNFGVVELGRRDSPFFEILAAVEPTGNGANMGLNDTLTNSGRGYARRISNQVRYETPTMSGFKGQLMYGLGESNTTTGTEESLNDVWNLSLAYTAGSLYLGYAYSSSKDASANNAAGVTTGVTPHKYNALAATYDLKTVKFYGMYYTDKRNSFQLTPTASVTPAIDQRVYAFGASMPFGASTVAAQYGKIKDKVSRTTGSADARQLSLSYLYTLSKRTMLYAGYSNYRNDNYTTALGGFAAYSSNLFDTASSSTATSSVTAKSNAWAFGIKHQF